MLTSQTRLREIVDQISRLPEDWHSAGTFQPRVLRRIAEHLASLEPGPSVETGTGKSTLLLSQWSTSHTVFAIDDSSTSQSYSRVMNSPLLKRESVKFVLGPSQRNVPVHPFEHLLQFILIDGPHGYPFPELEYYFLYRHLRSGGLLVLDDIDIPTVHRLYEFLREEPMFELLEVARTTAFFKRTDFPVFDPYCDGWSEQPFNSRRYPDLRDARGMTLTERAKAIVPTFVKQRVKLWVSR